jgi:EF-P beta-lysylation protein EpmB
MITQISLAVQRPLWQAELARAVRSPAELLKLLGLPVSLLADALQADKEFPLRVPRSYVARMRLGDVRDPLLRQVLPVGEEGVSAEGYTEDAVGELQAMPAAGLLRKYHGRALLITTGACAVHCRYCFRRHFPYADAARDEWRAALDCLAQDASISEVILSGGDPLTLSDARLAQLAQRLAAIAHIKYLRIHTRLPIVLPERVDDGLLDWLTGTRLKLVMVVHVNHAQELDGAVREALMRLTRAGVALFNQSVLLKGVNDSAETLAALSQGLFDAGVTPYYLHLLDRVRGAAHFEVNEARALELIRQVRAQLPGYLVPRLVRELAGAPAKQPLA